MAKQNKIQKNKSPKHNPNLFGYSVRIDSKLMDKQDPVEEYGDWSQSWNNCFYSITKAESMPNCVSTIDLTKQQGGFLVWTESSWGDSFGTSNRENVTVVAVGETIENAKHLKKALLQWTDGQNRDNTSGYDQFKVVINGQEIKTTLPWGGYFDHLDEIHIQEISKI